MPRLTALLLAVSLAVVPLRTTAEERDSLFTDYADYSAYVDRMLTTRAWADFILRMGGRDEYTPQQLTKIAADFDAIYPAAFTQRTLFREVDLGGGIRQEARAYWNGGSYLFYYAILHQRDDALVVLNFSMNSKIEPVMARF
ncbi:hypothetical protein [Marimonas arenosa]|uniref:DUF3887 domain-containing protein n=1 Tax=Marimonas arenosa TaxID=1795305 RepID=A0AAE3WBH8_9RHOB|nr:hypothetical protein [Marimonas arenosa]MDQ2088603.1 hypothetical protein [Marimonas arenosa]